MGEIFLIALFLALAAFVLWLFQKVFGGAEKPKHNLPSQSQLDHHDRMSEVGRQEREIEARRSKLNQKKKTRQAKEIDDIFSGDLRAPDDD